MLAVDIKIKNEKHFKKPPGKPHKIKIKIVTAPQLLWLSRMTKKKKKEKKKKKSPVLSLLRLRC